MIAVTKSSKFCTQCQRQRPIEGGVNITFADGKRFRWRCAECHEKISKRLAKDNQ